MRAFDVLQVLLEIEAGLGAAASSRAAVARPRRSPAGRRAGSAAASPAGCDRSARARPRARRRFRARGRCPARVRLQQLRSASGEKPSSGFPISSRELRQEVIGDERHVVGALAQRRQHERNHVEAIEQIFAELPFAHQLRQVAIGGGDDADVGRDLFGAADAADTSAPAARAAA